MLKRCHDVSELNENDQGEYIDSAWPEIFSQYQIQEFQVVEQQRCDRGVAAQIQITALVRSRTGRDLVNVLPSLLRSNWLDHPRSLADPTANNGVTWFKLLDRTQSRTTKNNSQPPRVENDIFERNSVSTVFPDRS